MSWILRNAPGQDVCMLKCDYSTCDRKYVDLRTRNKYLLYKIDIYEPVSFEDDLAIKTSTIIKDVPIKEYNNEDEDFERTIGNNEDDEDSNNFENYSSPHYELSDDTFNKNYKNWQYTDNWMLIFILRF
ncbi:hypothetical protein RCL_jg24019.t1 [Rhizophagus clarus]|uniref:Uncharacterized protein n=1 Tax=Rhizophagus clarus TaxID=94130 RepID=A0A8H3QQN9_9GLOM|nr:hypothetical protein RCL_jg24019.t1 [Rhizophagus clarus]